MDYIQKAQEKHQERPHAARAVRARRWSRRVFALLILVFLYAVWQDRALAPPIHDGMQKTVSLAAGFVENSGDIRSYVKQTFGSSSGTSVEQQYDPITRWLLKWTS
ncbi:MAG: hypothetical protein RLO10_08710 [Roseovarius indicus]